MSRGRIKKPEASQKSNGSDKPALSFADLPSEESSSGSEIEHDSEEGDANSELESDLEAESASESENGPENDVETNDTAKPKASSKKHGASAEQVRVAREASELFRSNVFKLQVEEVLKEIAVEEKYSQAAKKALFTLRQVFTDSKSIKPVAIGKARSLVQSRIPFSDPAPDPKATNYKFAYDPPQEINIIGSYGLNTHTKRPEGCGIDMLLVMPPSLFEEKDYVNYRYFHKRAFYLAAVADIIASKGPSVGLGQVRYKWLNDDPLKPVLKIDFAQSHLAKRFHLVIHLGVPADTFNVRKLAPDRNSVRIAQDKATPRYNASVLSDMAHDSLLAYLWKAKRACPAYLDAVKLGSLWLRQVGFGSRPGQGGFGNFELAVLIAALLKGGRKGGKRVLLHGFSSYQILRALLLWLVAEEDVDLEFSSSDHTVATSSGRLVYKDLGLDILAHTPQWGIQALKYQAAIAVDLLGDAARDRFAALFLKNSSQPRLRFDWSCEIVVPPREEEYRRAQWPRYHDFVADEICTVLQTAWQARCRGLVVAAPTSESWSLSSAPPATAELQGSYHVGAWINPDEAEKRVTFAEPGQTDFKDFWGSRASVRRFQDGNIREAVVWKHGVRPIVQEITECILERHLQASVDSCPLVDRFLPAPSPALEVSVSSTAQFQQHNQAFQQLSQTLQELRDLPLRISAVFGLSPSMRYASVEPPMAYDPASPVGAGAIEFESSGRWPKDPVALEKTMTAFLVRIAELVRKQAPKYHPIIGVEAAGEAERGFLMVQTPTGHYFKLYILNNNASFKALADHTRFVSTAAQRFSNASASMRILKIWFQRHLLASHITEEAIELLALKPFLDSAPWGAPASVTTAFLRAMDLLSTWNWKLEPIILDATRDETTNAHHSTVEGTESSAKLINGYSAAFEKQRKLDPVLTHAPWVIFTQADPTGTAWTSSKTGGRTALLLASRVTALARVATKNNDKLKVMFVPSLSDFDVEFSVDNSAAVIPGSIAKNLAVSDPGKAIIDGTFNPGFEFFKTIQEAYRDCLVLFYTGSLDDRGSDQEIVGVWTKQALEPHKFKVGTAYPTTKIGKDGLYAVDKKAVLSEIERLGKGMVELVRS